MLLFIFPKVFEKEAFVKSFDGYYEYPFKTISNCTYCIIKDKEAIYVCLLLIIKESDIEFTIKLTKIIQGLKTNITEFESLYFVLIGSCGTYEKLKINDILTIKEVLKISIA